VEDPENQARPGQAPAPTLADAFRQAPVGLAVTTADGRLVHVNEALAALLGRSPAELTGTRLDEVAPSPDAARLRDDRDHVVSGRGRRQGRFRLRRSDGSVVPVSVTVGPLRDASGDVVGAVVQVEDVTALEEREDELAHRALHDPLTGLPNRVLFGDRLDHALARLRREDSSLALLFVDIDGFKAVNDRFGHEEGDRVLVEAARRLAGAVRPGDTAARFGGDEFVVLCESAVHEEAGAVAERVTERWQAPIEVGSGEHITLGCSIGVAVTDSPDTPPDLLLRQADAAMYRRKIRGGP
jgi:diguanylate cyclase (GGDEF)-like protein/PAS domain S-box-containing protein